jgi:hypothetical protein
MMIANRHNIAVTAVQQVAKGRGNTQRQHGRLPFENGQHNTVESDLPSHVSGTRHPQWITTMAGHE